MRTLFLSRFFCSALLIIFCFSLSSCFKNVYTLSTKEINGYAREASEPGYIAFVVYGPKDTIKGTVLKRKSNAFNQNEKWLIDGREINSRGVSAFQDQYGYTTGEYTRLVKGKMSLFYKQTETAGGTIGSRTSFHVLYNGAFKSITYNSLKEYTKSCPEAFKQVGIEFDNEIWAKPKYVNTEINDYRALINIVKLYNKCD